MQITAPKIMLIVLVVLALLFISGIFLGASHNSGEQVDLSPGWIQGIQQTFAKPEPFELKDISGASPTGCLRQDGKALVIGVNKTCTYTISKSATNVRRLVFNLQPAGVADLLLDQQVQGKDSLSARQILPLSRGNSNNPDHLDVYQDGGKLTVFCRPVPGLSQCLMTTPA